MLLENVLSCEWMEVPGYAWLNAFEKQGVTKNEIEQFAKVEFYKAAERLQIKYDVIKDLLYGKNIEFFKEVERLFAQIDEEDETEIEVTPIKEDKSCIDYTLIGTSLLVPYRGDETCTVVDIFLETFEKLGLTEKVQVLRAFQKGKLSVYAAADIFGDKYDCINKFNALNMDDKCEVAERILTSDVVFGE